MNLSPIREGIPPEVSSQLMSSETLYYFSYISLAGGCGSSSSGQKYWIALTDSRILYKTKIQEAQSFVEKDGILPLDKVSFIEVSEGKAKQGCSSSQIIQLSVSTSGGNLVIPIPTKEKGYEIRKVFTELTHKG